MAQTDVIAGNKALILGKAEATYGTDPTPDVANNALYCMEYKIEPVIDLKDIKRFGPTFTSRGKLPGAKYCKFSFKFPFVGAPDPGGGNLAEPDYSPILQACGFALASTGAPVDTHTFTPSSSQAQPSVTFFAYLFEDGHTNAELYELNGAVGNVKVEIKAGEAVAIMFEGEGLYVKPITVSAPALGSLAYVDPTDEMPAINATFTVGGAAFFIRDFEIDLRWSMDRRLAVGGGVEGVAGIYLTRAPNVSCGGKMTMEMKKQSTDDRWQDIADSVLGVLSIIIDSIGGTRLNIAAPALQLLSPTFNPEVGVIVYDQPYDLQQTTDEGDDYVTFTLTRTP